MDEDQDLERELVRLVGRYGFRRVVEKLGLLLLILLTLRKKPWARQASRGRPRRG